MPVKTMLTNSRPECDPEDDHPSVTDWAGVSLEPSDCASSLTFINRASRFCHGTDSPRSAASWMRK